MSNHAILLIDCTDQKGIVAMVTEFLLKNNGNIIELDQHVDTDGNHFFMRVEWELEGFHIPEHKIGEYFETLVARKFGDMHWHIHFTQRVPRLAIFVSKYAHCFFDLLSRYEAGDWQVEIPLIISNHDTFRHVAERHNIPFHHFPITSANKAQQEAAQLALIKEEGIDLIVLARYMQILSADFVKHHPNQIINIHHSSLPAFPGANPYENAFKRGVKFMGATAHYVTSDLDEGPIIAQDVININHRDSIADLKRRGRDIEKIVLASAIWSHLNHKVLTYKNKTVVFD